MTPPKLAAICSAAAWVTFGCTSRPVMAVFWATDVAATRPDGSTTTTKSPPMTGIPRYVRWYGTYCQPADE